MIILPDRVSFLFNHIVILTHSFIHGATARMQPNRLYEPGCGYYKVETLLHFAQSIGQQSGMHISVFPAHPYVLTTYR